VPTPISSSPGTRSAALWAFVITAIAASMAALDHLVVITALPVIQADFGATLSELEWMINGYTLTFAVLLLTGAALGDRFGRKRLLVIGLGVFTVGSAAAALSSTSTELIVARAVQGLGGAILTPLSLTILSAAMPKERRAMALGAWGGITGIAIALGPLVGGAIAEGLAWQSIFWINVPIGLVAIPLAVARLDESYGPATRLDLPGLGLVSAGLLALVWAMVSGNDRGWADPTVVIALVVGAILVAAFIAWEARTSQPLIRLDLFRSRAFSAANIVSLMMFFGIFGSIFLLAQFFQTVQGYSPLEAGLRTLPWTAMPLIAAPVAGIVSSRTGTRPLLVAGMGLQAAALAWLSFVVTPTVEYLAIAPAFVMAGVGMGLFVAPIANVVLSAVKPEEEGQASGATNAIRELGAVFGVAVLAAVFAANGSYASPTGFVNGLVPALQLGAVAVAIGAIAALALPGRLGVPAVEATPNAADAVTA
jgi:EmrB/QacA subfamily drug resistance transporter